MKPFDLEKAKAGAPVCTKDGKDARIICFDAKSIYPIAALILNGDTEYINSYTNYGRFALEGEDDNDLMMKEIHHEGWINIYNGDISPKECGRIIHDSEEDAKRGKHNTSNYITTVKIEWDE